MVSRRVRPLLFYNQYLEIATSLPNGPAVYGLGERITSLKLPLNSIFTLWNADQGNPPDINLYGSHPFALRLEAETMAAGAAPSANGVFLFNSNAMDALLGQQSLAFRAVGGVVDLFFFAGPTPAQVVM
jgi:alpha-glucosidase